MSKYIDLDDALTRMCGNKKIYAKTLNMFLDSKELEAFEAAMQENDFTRAGGHIHTLKGVAGNLSLTALFEQSEPLIQKLRQGELDTGMIENYRETHAQTRAAVQQLIPQLSA